MTNRERPDLTLTGLIPPMITPLTRDRELDPEGIERLVGALIGGGVSGIFVLGSSGEGAWLTARQCREVVERTVRAARGAVPVLAGIIEPSTRRALEALENVVEAGADAVVAASPYYFAVSPAEQIAHFSAIARVSPVPVVLYNIPPLTHNPIPFEVVRALADTGRVAGIKDSSADWEHFERLIALKAQRPDFRILQGAEKPAAQSILAGADGLVPGLGNLRPDLFAALYKAARAGERERAAALQEQVNHLWTLHSHGYWLVCLKYAASLLGFGSGATCGHDDALTDAARAAIRHAVEQVNIRVS